MKIKFLIILGLIISGVTKAQVEEDSITSQKYTPYELLSSYYNKDFKPFKKGTIYTGFAMSLED